jgi:riboflavin kinase / FMN adenylyltransferase
MLDAETYVKEILLKQLQVKHLVIGYDHKFGNNRMGDIQTLKEFSKVHNFSIDEISAQDIDHIAISSSKIRKAIEQGDLNLAGEFLGHFFFLSGLVVKGKQLGRTIGYPTANLRLEADEKILPKIGVYFVGVEVEETNRLGMMSIGFNPTTDDDKKIKLEVNIFDFDEDIYGKTVKVTFYSRLRDEEKFANLDELKSQLRLDRESCIYRLQALLI